MKHIVRLLAISVALIGIEFLLSSSTLRDQSSCERTSAWVSEHLDSLPVTLAEIQSFPPNYQRSIVSALSPSEKAGLWRARLDAELTNGKLTINQQAAIKVILGSLDHTWWMRGARPPSELERRVEAVFPTDQRMTFYSLGYSGLPTGSVRAARIQTS